MFEQKEEQWFSTTFTQLPDIAKRQVGSIVGALIADAAVNNFDFESMSCEEIELFKNSNLNDESTTLSSTTTATNNNNNNNKTLPQLFRKSNLKTFAPRKKSNSNSSQQQQQKVDSEMLSLMKVWSPASVASIQVLNAIEDSKSVDHDFWQQDVSQSIERVIQASKNHPQILSSMPPANFSLFPLIASIPIVAVYPWANDLDVHENIRGVFDAVMNVTYIREEEEEQEISSLSSSSRRKVLLPRVCPDLTVKRHQHQQPAEVEEIEVEKKTSSILQHYLAGSSILLRCLQSNPDPIKNGLLKLKSSNLHQFSLLPGFEEEIPAGGQGEEELVWKLNSSSSWANVNAPPSNAVLLSAFNIIRKDLHHAPTPQRFEMLIRQCISESIRCSSSVSAGGRIIPPTHLATFVGACLGARYGVRKLPVEWMNVCDDRSQGALTKVVSNTVSMTQWCYNPSR